MNYSITQQIARQKETATGTMANGLKFKSCIYAAGSEWITQLVYFEIEEDGCVNEVNNPYLFKSFTKAECKAHLMSVLAA